MIIETKPIRDKIEKRQADIREWRRKIEIAEIEIATYEDALNLIGGDEAPYEDDAPVPITEKGSQTYGRFGQGLLARRGGRQPGSVTQKWRVILAHLLDGRFDDQTAAHKVYEIEGRSLRPSEARRVLESYVSYGYLHQNEAGYKVTELAIQKFGLAALAPVDEPETNKAPDEDPGGNTSEALIENPEAQGREAGPGGGT